MSTKKNNRISLKKQVNTNTKRFKVLMKDIRNDVKARTRNSKDLEEWLEKLHPYVGENCLINGVHGAEAAAIIRSIVKTVEMTKLPPGANQEIVKGVMSEACMTYVTNVGKDIQTELQRIAVESYNNKLAPKEIADVMAQRIDVLSTTRCQVIARTETMRANNLSNLIAARENGAQSYTIECDPGACELCLEKYKELEGDQEIPEASNESTIFDIMDTDNFPPFHPNCYLPDTKVFTSNGWKYFKDISEDDKILSLNPMTNEIEFLPHVKLVEVNNVSGLMYHIFNKWFDICITPDHDCFIHQRRDGGEKGRFIEPQFRKPSELSSESRFVRCIDYEKEGPDTVNINGLEFHSADFAFLMAWYISEGSVLHNPETAKAKGYPIKITQQIQENRDLLKPILERICDYLNIKLYVGKQYFELHSKPLYDYLVQLGYSHEKYIPNEVFGLSKKHLNIFLDNYVLGDGHQRKLNKFNSSERAVFTSSRRLCDDLSLIVLLCGFYPSIYVHNKAFNTVNHQNGEYTSTNPVYGIRINNSRYTNFSNCNVEEIFYDGKVYCVELPKYHTLWVMRNGKTSWNGNCRCTPRFSTKTVEQRLGGTE